MACRIIHDNRGIVDKFIGDGIMAIFGFNSDDKTQGALNAVISALQLREDFKPIRQKWMEVWSKHFTHHDIDIDVKCGIHSGSVLFGLLDGGSRYQVTIWVQLLIWRAG
jgi:class 3 adenylate cyclase